MTRQQWAIEAYEQPVAAGRLVETIGVYGSRAEAEDKLIRSPWLVTNRPELVLIIERVR